MNVKELIEILKQKDENLEIVPTWEGITVPFNSVRIFEVSGFLIMDCNEYLSESTKQEYISGESRVTPEYDYMCDNCGDTMQDIDDQVSLKCFECEKGIYKKID